MHAGSSPTALKVCNASVDENLGAELEAAPFAFAPHFGAGPGPNNASVLWNAMIVPYTVGPMTLKGFTWFQVRIHAPWPGTEGQRLLAGVSLLFR